MRTKNLITLILLAAVVVFGISFISKQGKKPVTNIDNQITGTISTTTDTQMVYVNENLGLKFNFPFGWHLGANTLGDSSGYGYLQLLNYDETKTSGSVFSEGTNKIEAVITDDNIIATSSNSDYVEKSRKITKIQVVDQTATRFDITLEGDQEYRVYIVPIKSKFLRMVIYGDPSNFYVLDNLVKTIQLF